MKIDHNELKLIYQKHTAEKKFNLRKNCPSVDEIINLVRSELPRDRKNIILKHIQECPSCSKEAQALIRILKEEKKFIKQIKKLPLGQRKRTKINKAFSVPFYFSWKFISVVTITLVLVFALSFFLHTILHEHRYRGNDLKAIKIIEPSEKLIIYENNIHFRWNDIPGTKFYKAVLFDHSLYPIWESDQLLNNRVKLPSEVHKNMKHKTTYFLMITSYQKNGKIIESSFKEFTVFVKPFKN
ncbi:MAG: hypothetical protein ACOC5G_00075 [Acidobacteriota bacterium]